MFFYKMRIKIYEYFQEYVKNGKKMIGNLLFFIWNNEIMKMLHFWMIGEMVYIFISYKN